MIAHNNDPNSYLDTLTSIALCASCFTIFSPMGSMFSIMRYGASGKEIMGLLVPYFMLFAQCYLWSWYGILLSNPSITRVNVLGTSMCLMYLLIMVNYASPKDRRVLQPMVALMVVMVVIASLTIASGFHMDRRKEMFSNVATLFAILLNVSPMVQIIEVVKTKNLEGFPVALTVAGFISSSLWSEYSIMIHAIPYLIPNLLAVVMNGMQIVVICWVYAKFGVESYEENILPLMADVSEKVNDQVANVKKLVESPHEFTKDFQCLTRQKNSQKESHNFRGFGQQLRSSFQNCRPECDTGNSTCHFTAFRT
eukprot:gnl/MRDRNA2_/MRDRNA2_112134_c0_seq1.p1 gnl/MRDRNA2_/MRDRNA2_112134_c0~~gnl/MRDRNA2_/MRDRNA2_112134_c0_seq1.p1  ORF type:complete len:310 (+),score=38.40 gnl/MRDRNA2_/MRDRNA2_112134_c0_seq1:156-1085(+)